MKNIALGRYLPLNSVIHKLDPRAKIIAMLLLMITIFIPSGWYGYLFLGIIIIATTQLAKLKLNFLWRAMKPMLFMLVFLLVINMIVIKTGPILVTILGFSIHLDAITQTLYIVIRLVLMIMITTILTATTKPLDLTLGIEDLLKPLQRFKVPAHEIAMMISIALRFIPTLIEETDRIMKAQASRGVDLQEGSLKEKVMAILSLIVPLFVSAFQRAEELANAMESRGYAPSRSRTRYKVLKMQRKDYVMLSIVVLTLCMNIGIAVFV